MPEYYVNSIEGENKRLEQAATVVRTYMEGRVCLAPVDLQRSNLKVLDSAANNGFWLSQLQALLGDPESATLIGTDIEEERFPNPPRPGIAMQIQDIHKPWPKSWNSTFDFVHQTLVLFQTGSKQRDAINSLARLVKPGGWIELMEPQYGEVGDADGLAHRQFLNMLSELWAVRGTKSDFAAGLEGMVQDCGFVDVRSVLLPVGAGPRTKKAAMYNISVETTVGGSKNIVKAAKLIPGGLKCISPEDFETWPARFEEELRTEGAFFPLRVVYGRKPDGSTNGKRNGFH